MELWLILLLMAGAVILIFGICALCLWIEKRFPSEKYDERQTVDRCKGYRFAFFVGLFYFIGVFFYIMETDVPSDVSGSLVLVGLTVMLMAQEFYCVLTNAAIDRWMSPANAMVGYFLFGATQLGLALYRLLAESWRFKNTTWLYAYMFMAVGVIGIGVVHLVQYLRNKE